MKDTADQSAALKQAFKHDPISAHLRAEVLAFPLEWDESCCEVEQGFDTCSPGSLVAEELAA